MKLKQLILVMLMAVFVGTTSCEEELLSNVPTLPTSFSIEDGAFVEDTVVVLSASGGTVEDGNYRVWYKYYVGTSVDDLREIVPSNGKVEAKLEPYTQYYWAVKSVSEKGAELIEGEMSEVRIFYCAPPFEIETDNGEGEWAAILRFKGLDIKGGTVSAKGDHEGYDIEPITIPAGQDSCYIPMSRHTLSQYNAYVKWWDDKIGQYYEPVIYTFEVSLDIQVGDKVIPVKNTAKEIILDKSSCVRDHEFNVYRVAKIGNQTWMVDDYRARSYVNKRGEVKNSDIILTPPLSTGERGVLYYMRQAYPFYFTIKGYSLPTFQDCKEFVDYIYNSNNLEIKEKYGDYGRNPESFDLVRSCEGWKDCSPLRELIGPFNAKPFGYILDGPDILRFGESCLFPLKNDEIVEGCIDGFIQVDQKRGLIHNSNYIYTYCSVRLIKE